MAKEPVELTLDLAETAVQFRRSYEECISSCRAALALRSDWQAQMRKCHEELGFRYVRLPGLLNDEMSVCLGGPDWLEQRFFNVDRLFDLLLKLGMRPLVQLSYMPTALAAGTQTAYHYRANVTPPRDFGQWENLVRELARHLAGRYGTDEVARWPFEVWNEPNRPDLWAGTREEYFELYRRSAVAVKSTCPDFQIGGPATAAEGWLAEFATFCREGDVPLDFLSTHHCLIEEAHPGASAGEKPPEPAAAEPLGKRARTSRAAAGDLPLHYTEWGCSASCNAPPHDGPEAAAFILSAIAENDEIVDVYSYRALSDLTDETGVPSRPFHGGAGLLNIHGIEKPAYKALRFLHEMGDERIPVTGSSKTVRALAASRGETTHCLLWNRLQMSVDTEPVHVRLKVPGTGGGLRATIERVDETHANPRAAWEQMDSPPYLTQEQLAQLRQASTIAVEPMAPQAEENADVLQFTLPARGVVRLTLWLAAG